MGPENGWLFIDVYCEPLHFLVFFGRFMILTHAHSMVAGWIVFSFAVVVVGSHNVRIDTHPLDGQIIVCGGISLNPIQGGF